MKRNYFLKFALGFAACALFFLSCQKESIDTTNNNNNVADSEHLSKFSVIDLGTNDTIFSNQYVYDGQKRIIATYQAETGAVNPEHDTSTHFYHGSDTLPYRTYTIVSGTQTSTSDYFLFYDGLDRVIKDSLYLLSGGSFPTVTILTRAAIYNGNNIYSTTQQVNDALGFPDTSMVYDTATIDGSGNVVTDLQYQHDYFGTESILYSTVTYDNNDAHIYPFSFLNTFGFGDYIFFSPPFSRQPAPSKKLVTSINQDYLYNSTGSTDFCHATMSYTFTATGKVSTADIIIDSQVPRHYKHVFVYTIL